MSALNLRGLLLVLSGVQGEMGKTVELTVLLPSKRKLSKVTLNGNEVASFAQSGDVLTLPVIFAGARFDHCHQVGTYAPGFSSTVFRTEFIVLHRIFAQLAERRKLWPISYSEEELLATWRGSDRLLLFIQIADPDDKWIVALKLNGQPIEVKKAYSDVFPLGRERTFTGFYADVSNIQADARHEVEVTLPENLRSGQFQGLFFENVEAEMTTNLKN